MWWLIRSPWGRAFVALRENPIRALSLGIDTRRYTLMAFAIGSALGGVAGTLYAPLTQYIDPVPFNLSLSLDLLMMVIVGGAGFFFGPFLGAMIAVLLPEWLRFTEGYYLMLYATAGDRAPDLFADQAFSASSIAGLAERRAQSRVRAARRREIRTRGRAMTAVLEVTDIRKSFGGITAVDGVTLRRSRGRNPRPDRTERLRQVDPFQLHSRPADAERRRGEGRRQGRHRNASLRAEPPRRQPHFPVAAGVSEIVGAGKSDPCRAGAPGQHDVPPVRPSDAGLTEAADQMIGFFKLDHLAGLAAGGLSYGQQKLLDAAMAFMGGPAARAARRARRRRQPRPCSPISGSGWPPSIARSARPSW